MKNYCYAPAVPVITMPDSDKLDVWKMFFVALSRLEYAAPFHTILAYALLLQGSDESVPPTMFDSLYCDLAIEIAADDRFPAMMAAIETGFYDAGFRMLIHATSSHDKFHGVYVNALRTLVNGATEWFKTQEIYVEACKVLGKTQEHIAPEEPHQLESYDLDWWVNFFQNQMEIDACAPKRVHPFL